MKIGHRRTQSAHLGSHHQDLQFITTHQHNTQTRHIQHLLRKSQLKTKQKVYEIETLNAPPKDQEDKLFNFGKGTQKEQPHPHILQSDFLACIPEKLKHHPSKVRKTADSENPARNKVKQKGLSGIVVSKPSQLKEEVKEKGKQPRKEGRIGLKASKVRQELREGKEVKKGRERKLSVYESVCGKSVRHKKGVSSLK